ncbi:hypothetical protein Leryth_025101, partial [Lithospermum erythrorhizon]
VHVLIPYFHYLILAISAIIEVVFPHEIFSFIVIFVMIDILTSIIDDIVTPLSSNP